MISDPGLPSRGGGRCVIGIDSETLDFTLESISEFARRELPDSRLVELDERDEFPEEIVRRMCGEELGVQLLFVPEEYGGMGGGAIDVYRVCERMASIDLGIATSVLATFLGSDPISVGGTPEQKQRWMSRIAEEGILMAYGATEPDAGSDLGALKTVAKPTGGDGKPAGYRITGAKQWISNGGVAELASVLAIAPGGPSWFVVESGAEGLSHGKPEDKHGIRLSNTAALVFEDVYVDEGALVGGTEGEGLSQAQEVFGFTRLMVAAFGLGAGWAALDRAIPYSQERIQSGGPLADKQGYTHKLIVPHAVRLEASRAAIEQSAERIDGGEGALNTEGAIAKYLATEAGNVAADAAIQALGGYGYTHEYMVEKIKRDVRITTIYEGTSEIMEMTIARDRWQQHLKTRGDHFHAWARDLEALDSAQPELGAGTAALAGHALAEVLEACRVGRLTRNQHVLLRLGELIALVEGAGALARRAARAATGGLGQKCGRRFGPEALATISRVNARDTAMRVGGDGLRLVVGGAGGDAAALGQRLGMPAIHAAQEGLLADFDDVADVLYDRKDGAMSGSAGSAIAVVGVGAILPDAPDAETFWSNLAGGHYAISEVDRERWDPELYFDPDPKAPEKTYSKIGGWVRDWEWEPLDWHLPIPPRVSEAMDHAQKWGVACTRMALLDYGWPDRPLDLERTAVVFGNAMAGEKHYLTALRVTWPELERELARGEHYSALPEEVRRAIAEEMHGALDDRLPPVTEDTMPGELGNCLAGRVSNLFNLRGPNYVVDAACASAMAAIDASIEGLTEHEFDAVITGGIDRNMGASTYIKFSAIGALSATGTRPYADGADGFVMGEGAALFVLKRLEDAERDGDRIYAVIRGMGGSSDGKGKGITAPNPIGQRLAVERAWRDAGLDPSRVHADRRARDLHTGRGRGRGRESQRGLLRRPPEAALGRARVGQVQRRPPQGRRGRGGNPQDRPGAPPQGDPALTQLRAAEPERRLVRRPVRRQR